MEILRIEKLNAGVGDNIIIRDINLKLFTRESILLLGPNASGKSTLLNSIAGNPRIKIFNGSIFYNSEDITSLDPVKRNEKGISIMIQNPPRLRGVKTRKLFDKICSRHIKSIVEREKEINEISKALQIQHLLDRDYGHGFSGGELKRAELATLIFSRPRLALIDEPDSGVDIDSIIIMATVIKDHLMNNIDGMILVTHTGGIVKYIETSRSYVIYNGRIIYEGETSYVLSKIFSEGFKSLLESR